MRAILGGAGLLAMLGLLGGPAAAQTVDPKDPNSASGGVMARSGEAQSGGIQPSQQPGLAGAPETSSQIPGAGAASRDATGGAVSAQGRGANSTDRGGTPLPPTSRDSTPRR